MFKFPLIISFYTKDSPYETWAQDLKKSCEEFGLEYDIEGIDSIGSWYKNCCYKPQFILKKLQEHKRPLFWVDADSVFLKKPILLNTLDCDLASRSFFFKRFFDHKGFASGSLYVNYNPVVLQTLKNWEIFYKEVPNAGIKSGDDWYLSVLLHHMGSNLRIYDLPPEYNAQTFTFNEDLNCHLGDIVILDRHGSIYYKKVVEKSSLNFCNQIPLANLHESSSLLLSKGKKSNYHQQLYDGLKENEKYEDNKLDLITRFLPKKPIILEAGALYGNDTIKLAWHWPKAKIISFEPNPNAFKQFLLVAKNVKNIYMYNLALDTFDGTTSLYGGYGKTGKNPFFEKKASLLLPGKLKNKYGDSKQEVPCVLLDNWCEKNSINHIDFLRLDIEGFELQILKTSPKTLKTIKAIYTKTNMGRFRSGTTRFPTLKKFLEKNGFVMQAHWYNKGLQGDAFFVRKELTHD